MKNRIELAQLFADLGFKVGAEIGVFAGYYSEILCKTIPGLKLHSIDTWADPSTRSAKVYAQAKERLAPYGVKIIKGASVAEAPSFKDQSLDFVYIDGNHAYESVKEDIEAWTPKVRAGGIVSGDDYYVTNHGNEGVVRAVNECAFKNNYALHTSLWDIDNPIEDDRQPCWYFVKEHA